MDYSLSDKWVLWAHLPHDTDWSLKSYYKIHSINNLNDSILINNSFSDDFIRNCMLFLMKDKITPIWEDPKNKNGGCFSFKVTNKDVPSIWKILFYTIVGDTITNDSGFLENICGITISPKKTFCIVKIWTSSCQYQNPTILNNIKGLNVSGCIFKKHIN
tara:strand:- start:2473 stop:2952 length:480 start_codon:yes stop_codon:yes gene_type:complete